MEFLQKTCKKLAKLQKEEKNWVIESVLQLLLKFWIGFNIGPFGAKLAAVGTKVAAFQTVSGLEKLIFQN